jgi:uncharacterized low-complexity protein
MNAQKKSLAIVLGGAFATALAFAPIANADQNPFAMNALAKGYQVADAKDGKCGTGKCGANKKKADGSCCAGGASMKKADGSCCAGGAEKKKADGTCSAEMKAKQGNCSADKKAN